MVVALLVVVVVLGVLGMLVVVVLGPLVVVVLQVSPQDPLAFRWDEGLGHHSQLSGLEAFGG